MSDPYRRPDRPTTRFKIPRRAKEKLLAVVVVAASATFVGGECYLGSDEFEANRIRQRTENKARAVNSCIESCAAWDAAASFNPHLDGSLECRCVTKN